MVPGVPLGRGEVLPERVPWALSQGVFPDTTAVLAVREESGRELRRGLREQPGGSADQRHRLLIGTVTQGANCPLRNGEAAVTGIDPDRSIRDEETAVRVGEATRPEHSQLKLDQREIRAALPPVPAEPDPRGR